MYSASKENKQDDNLSEELLNDEHPVNRNHANTMDMINFQEFLSSD